MVALSPWKHLPHSPDQTAHFRENVQRVVRLLPINEFFRRFREDIFLDGITVESIVERKGSLGTDDDLRLVL